MKVNKEVLYKLYVEDKKTTYDIAKQLGVHRTTVGKALKRFGIVTRYEELIRRVSNRKLNDYQKTFIIGSLLGDGCIDNAGNRTSRYVTSHSEKQKEYIDWVKSVFGDLGSKITRQVAYNKKYKRKYVFYNFSTLRSPELNLFKDMFYDNSGKKIIPNVICDMLKETMSLAVWIMEDGTFNRNNKSTYLCTECFTYNEHEKLAKALKVNFGLIAKIVSYKNNFRLRFGAKEASKIKVLVNDHILNSMKYKIFI